jgi:hypothetical protein
MSSDTLAYLQLYQRLDLTPVPLKPRLKESRVRWRNGQNATSAKFEQRVDKAGINWGIRGDPEFGVLDFHSAEAFNAFRRDRPEIAPTTNLRYQAIRPFS